MGASRGALLLRLILTNASFLAFSEKSTRLSARRLVLFSIGVPLLPINSMYSTRICLICTNVVQFLPLLSPRVCLWCSRLVICGCRRPSGRCCVQYQCDLDCTLFSCRPMLKNNVHAVGGSRYQPRQVGFATNLSLSLAFISIRSSLSFVGTSFFFDAYWS